MTNRNLIEETLKILDGTSVNSLRNEVQVTKRNGRGGFPEQTPGEPGISVTGEEIPNSIALGKLSIAHRDSSGDLIIESEGIVSGEQFVVDLRREQAQFLKKIL